MKENWKEKRQSTRVPCDILSDNEGKIGDISAEGVHLELRSDFAVNERVGLKFSIPINKNKIQLEGIVRRKHRTNVGSMFGYGIEFNVPGCDNESIKLVSKFIESRRQQPLSLGKGTDNSAKLKSCSKKSPKLREVVITGIGLISPFGDDLSSYWDKLLAGESHIRKVDDPFVEGTSYFMAPIENFSIKKYQDEKYYMRLRSLNEAREKCFIGREVDMQIASVGLALKDGSLDFDRQKNRIGVVLGFETCGFVATERGYLDLVRAARENPELSDKEIVLKFYQDFLFTYMNTCSFSNLYYTTAAFGLHGPSTSINTASASGMVALHQAITSVQCGDADVMLAGASEDLIDSSLRYHIFKRFGVHSKDKNVLPWDTKRDGSIMGEAAVTIMVEDKEHAVKRGAKIYAEINASTINQDGFHILSPELGVKYLSQSYKDVCEKSSLSPESIDLVLPHSTGTRMNDQIQSDAIGMCFPHNPYVTSFSSQIGHALCASGLLRVITGSLALQHQTVPPTVGITDPDPKCPANIVPKPVKTKIEHVACSAISYGGTNAAVMLSCLS